MTVYFETDDLKKLFETPLQDIKGKQKFQPQVIRSYKSCVAKLMAINKLEELRPFRGLNFEYLKGDKKGQCSLRLNDQYRLIITPVDEDTVVVIVVNEISKHYE